MTKFKKETKVVEPKTYKVWAVDRATKEVVTFEVDDFTRQEALKFAAEAYKENNPEGCRIRVCALAKEFEEECKKWLERAENAKIKNSARKIAKANEIIELLNNENVNPKVVDKILEVVDLLEYKQYI